MLTISFDETRLKFQILFPRGLIEDRLPQIARRLYGRCDVVRLMGHLINKGGIRVDFFGLWRSRF